MQFLLSINDYFYPEFDYLWLDYFIKCDIYNKVSGCEINSVLADKKEKEYILKLIDKIKHWRIQFHAPHKSNTPSDYTDILNFYEDISQKVGYKLNVTFHPIESYPTVSQNIEGTKIIMQGICNLVEKNRIGINVCLENLNKSIGRVRCNLDDIYQILDIENVNLTWDIGHQVVDGNCNYSLNEKYIGKLNNIHIHDVLKSEHYPFYFDKTNLNKCFDYLHNINYDGPMVAEIGLNCLESTSFEERIAEYVKNIYILSYYNEK